MKIEEEVEVLEEEVEELQVVPKPKAKPAIQAPVEKAHEDSPSRRIYQFLLDVQNIGIMLDSDIDRSAPVLRVFAALRSVEVCQHGRQIHMPLETFALSAGGPCKQMMRVKADGFNLEVGRFEPLLETFELGCQLVKDDITGTEVHVFGRKPLLLNVNPVILRRLQWYSRRLAGSVVPMPDEPKPVPVRYALLNLSGVPVGLHLKLKDIAADAWMDVPPTGQTWRCLDNLDFTFPPSVGVAVAEPHVPASRRQIARLDLGLLNCIRIPNSQLIVQLRRPSVLGAVVLISSKVLIFNETSIPLALRFDGSKPLVWTSCASSDLLDGTADFYESQVRDGCTPGAVPSWLMPGGLASVPLDLPQPKDDDDDDDDEEDEDEGATSWEMMMQTEPNMWGKASFSFNSTYASVQCGSQHLLAVVDYETLAPPASEKLMNVKLLPPLQLTSCLPCKVEVQYHSLGEAVESSRQVEIAETDTVRIYDIGFPQTVRIRARVIGGEWSEWGTLELNEEDIGEEDRRLSRLEAEMQVDTPGFGEYTFALLDKGNGKVQLCCQTWLIDRTGWNLSVEREGPLIDAGDGVLLCGNNVKYHKISSNGRCGPEFSLPSGQNDWTITTTHEGTNVTVRARPLPGQQDHTTRCLEIVPRHIVQNLTEHPVEFRSGDCRVVVQPMDMESPKFTSENLQFRPSTASAWSVDIPAIEESAGTASIAVGRFCWTVDIRADHGTIYVSIKPGSKYALWNRLPKGECEIRVRSLQFRALAGEVVDFAWVDPFFKDKDLEAELILEEEDFTINPRTMYQKKLRGRLELFSSFENSTTFLEVREKQSYEQPIAAMTLNLVLPRIGVPLMGRSPHRVRISELLYLELALLQVVASTKPKQDMQVLNFALGDLSLPQSWYTFKLCAFRYREGNWITKCQRIRYNIV
ncbi:Hypothetical protein (Fragment) [Durusdinium trenchii]|uniref:Vacuolar protein sorting-associated protein 13 VPS13 adaptor binding domain-containing protein n=1 Tax=Durusdinium trenchii TaxID=1381693 RepID=A0ABP0PLH7_9DINO